MFSRLLFASLLTTSLCLAQSGDKGDKPGESQKPLVPKALIPPATVLTPEQALKTFKLAPGFRIELVASEPLIHDPVQIAFDPAGRLWVLEMSGYMPTADAKGEFEKVGKLVYLEDTHGDGKLDKRTVFLDGLVMPRAFALVGNGVLVAEPPKLWFIRNDNGKAGAKIEVANDYATAADPKLGARANPEHSSNGLMGALDNWIYSANHTTRFRYADGEWQRSPTSFRGQWGLTQDDFGRLVHNSNSDQLRYDLVPSAYLVRNPYYRGAAGLNVQPMKDQATWPIRPNPGVNRGYRAGQLRTNDWTLATFTAACGPLIYRGDNFPAEFKGNAFLCEPSANMIRRNVLTEQAGTITGQNAYQGAEFLASTDEWFRPINLNNGPDGALYLVDFCRGIIQHRIYLTSYLRQQSEDRSLVTPIGRGRIYRVVAEGKPLGPKPQLAQASTPELVKALSHPNGWWRDTAQRLLVERAPESAVPLLKDLATTGKEPLGRLHALWTLDGMGRLDAGTVTTALEKEQHSKIRAAAIRLAEQFLKTDSKTILLPKLIAQAGVRHPDVQLQLAFTLGETTDPKAEEALARIAQNCGTNIYIRDAVITGLGGRELEFAQRILDGKTWSDKQPGNDEIISRLAKCVFTQAKGERVGKLLELVLAPTTAPWQRIALLNGMASTAPVTAKRQPAPRVRPVKFTEEPKALAALKKLSEPNARAALEKIDQLMVWPGKPGVLPEPPVIPLTAAQQARFDLGKQLFESSCAACHQPHGLGQEGLAPPLLDSEWVMGLDLRLARIVLHGVRGPISVKGQKFDLDMPSFGTFDDAQIAAILTYVRREWEHTFAPVEPETISKVRAENARRIEAWTEPELLKVK